MTNIRTQQPLRVVPIPNAGAYIDLLYSQTGEVLRLLESHGVRHWLSEDIFSWEDGPFEAVIVLSKNENPERVQAILDSVP